MDARSPSQSGHGFAGDPAAPEAGADERTRGVVTELLLEWDRLGERESLERLLPLVYDELHRIAHRHLRLERTGHTLGTTALVHEAYLRLVDQTRVRWADRTHFFAVAARVMRRVLVDYARRYRAAKRGGNARAVDLDVADVPLEERSEALIALDEALERLAELNPRLSRVVECRFFGGMTEEETAEALGVTARTVRRDWVKARGWLSRELQGAAE
jgi:RNA polymerase sigma factor (TIGR02999 family)